MSTQQSAPQPSAPPTRSPKFNPINVPEAFPLHISGVECVAKPLFFEHDRASELAERERKQRFEVQAEEMLTNLRPGPIVPGRARDPISCDGLPRR